MGFGVAGAIPFVAGGRRLLAQRPAIGSARQPRDPVLDQITHEMGRMHAQILAHGARPEHVHALAGQMRVVLAHAQATGLDDRVRRGLGDLVDARGRDTVIDRELDDGAADAELRAYGFDPSKRERSRHLDREQRANALDALLTGGLTPQLARLNGALDGAEQKANKMGATIPIAGPHTIVVQDCWQSWGALIDVMNGCAWAVTMMGAPELGAMLEGCTLLCDLCMYVCCWGG
jgi:hypothetical protein